MAIRHGEWKLFPSKKARLYNLKKDPSESTDVVANHPEKVKFLRKLLAEIKR